MKKRYKGSVLLPFIIGILVTVVIVAVIIFACGGLGFGGGKGDGIGEGSVSAIEVFEEQTEITTEEIQYINITISGSDYIYQNQNLSLDEIINNILADKEIPVKITDDNASLRAYDSLVKSLKDNNIKYIEQEL